LVRKIVSFLAKEVFIKNMSMNAKESQNAKLLFLKHKTQNLST